MLKKFSLVFGLVAALASPVFAQVPSTNPPYNTEVNTGAPIFNDSAVGAGTYNSAPQVNLDKVGVACSFLTLGESGSVSRQLNIQAYNSGVQTLGGATGIPLSSGSSASWTTIASTAAADGTAWTTPKTVVVSPGIQTTSLPTNYSAAVQLHLPRFWRLQEVVAGSGMTVTGPVGCTYFR